MSAQTNNSISVDCVVFGFDENALKVLLVERRRMGDEPSKRDYKLPGSLINEDEDLPSAASRVLEEMTGLRGIYLKQMNVFSDPARVTGEEMQWLRDFYGVHTNRVITVAYYSLVKLSDRILTHTRRKNARWTDVQSIKKLALDHKTILVEALSQLSHDVATSPIAFELLPKKFTIRQLQNLYSIILGVELDSRNFRKKILASGHISPTDQWESGVAHKPAQYYVFNKGSFRRERG